MTITIQLFPIKGRCCYYLKVTPQINESDYVTLTVFQEVQEVEEDSQGLDVATAGFIIKRPADTTVVVRDNQTVVIGGLIGPDTEVETKILFSGIFLSLENYFEENALVLESQYAYLLNTTRAKAFGRSISNSSTKTGVYSEI